MLSDVKVFGLVKLMLGFVGFVQLHYRRGKMHVTQTGVIAVLWDSSQAF